MTFLETTACATVLTVRDVRSSAVEQVRVIKMSTGFAPHFVAGKPRRVCTIWHGKNPYTMSLSSAGRSMRRKGSIVGRIALGGRLVR